MQDLTLSDLVQNTTLLSNLVGAHIVKKVLPWETILEDSYSYFYTLNPCATFFSTQQPSGALLLQGQGMLQGRSANITESDLVAGKFALIQVLDAVLLPWHKYGSGCITKPWKPPAPTRRFFFRSRS